MYQVLVVPQFAKDLKRIPLPIQLQTDSVIALLKNNPMDKTLNIKKLRGIAPSVWRVRIGSYRLVYKFDSRSLILLRFCHRKDVYRNL